jgi:DNA-binding NtrC family response regulator
MNKILIVDDEQSMRLTLSLLFKKQGYRVSTAASGEEAVAAVDREIFDIVITDLKMKKMGGLEVLHHVKKVHPSTEVIILTAHGTIVNAVEAMKLGAFDYLTKPFEPDESILVVKKALERKNLLGSVEQLQNQVRDKYRFENLVGKSSQFQTVLDTVRTVAPTDSTVLLQGETGTGKELVAKAIHNLSRRRESSFIALNCGSLPAQILESELFGYVRGAFTGADRNKEGLFSAADGGTLFLDEITGTLPEFQVSLLRVLQEGEIRRIGGLKTEPVDVRLLVATNQDLKKLVKESKFREDLFHRLNVVPIEIPPLRERREDIPILTAHFLELYAGKLNRSVPEIDPGVLSLFQRYPWPGNIRELEHTIERALIFCSSGKLTEADFGEIVSTLSHPERTGVPDESLTLKELEKRHIAAAMKRCRDNQTQAAQQLGIGRNTLWRKLKEYNLPAIS